MDRRRRMTPPQRNGRRAPVPEGWPGDDPTVQDDVALLGGRRHGRHDRRRASRRGGTAAAARHATSGEPGGRALDPDGHPEDHADGPDDHADRHPDVGGDALGADAEGSPTFDGTADDRLDAAPDLDPWAGDGRGAADDDAIAGREPAGRVLVVMVAALVLAMLVNADVLVERAERRPPGPDRDRALAVWHPVQDVSHVLQLHRIRQAADRVVGDDGGDGDDRPLSSRREARTAPSSSAADPTTTSTVEGGPREGAGGGGGGAPVLRTPTEDEPLRLWVGGDSMADTFAPALAAVTEETGLVDPTVRVENASGLVRDDYFDWSETLPVEVDEGDSEVVVFVAGTNDGQGIVLPDGTAVSDVADPRWATEYRRRAGALMDRVQADNRLVLWVLLPPMGEPGYGERLRAVRKAVVAAADSRPWVVTVDAATVLAGPDGTYAPTLPGPDGQPVEVRRSDGIHLADAGAGRLAGLVHDVISAHVDIRSPAS